MHYCIKTNFIQQRNKSEERLDSIRLKADYMSGLNYIINNLNGSLQNGIAVTVNYVRQ